MDSFCYLGTAWSIGGEKEGLYRLGIGSEIDLVTWQYDLATKCSGSTYSVRNIML